MFARLFSAALLLVTVVACDRTFPTRLSGRVTNSGAPARGLVLPLVSSARAVPLDANGQFDASYGGLNRSPSNISVLVYVPGARPVILHPGRDLELVDKGGVMTGSIDLELTRAPQTKALALACNAGQCAFDLPADARACATMVMAVEGDRVDDVFPRMQTADGGLTQTFETTSHPNASFVALVSCGRADLDYVSDAITPR